MNMLHLNIVRKKQFYGYFMPITVNIFTKESQLVCRKRIMSWKPVNIQLPKKDYIVTFSNKLLLARTVSSSVTVNGDVADEIWIEAEISNIHWLYVVIPFLGLLTPLFDYRISTVYQRENAERWRTKRRKVKLLSIPFLLLGIFSLFEIIGIGMNQLYLPDVEIEQWALEGTDAYTMYTYELLGEIVSGVIIIPILAVLLMLSMLIFRNINQRKRPEERKAVDENSPSILYLRPFGDDKLTEKKINMFLRPGISEEEALVSVLDDIAPVLCIGRPGKKYLPDGAARITIPTDAWKEKAAQLAQKAELVVLRLGKTDGVLWELQYCLENLDLSKLAFILPNFESASDWERIRDILKRRGIDSIDSLEIKKRKNKGSIWGFLYFDEKKQPVYRPLSISRMEAWIVPLEDKMKEALEGVCTKYGLKVQKRKNKLGIAAFCIFCPLFAMVMIIYAFVTFKSIEHGRFPQDLIQTCQTMEGVGETIDGWSSKGKADFLFYLFLNGLMFQEDESIADFYAWEAELMNCINVREYELLTESAEGYPTRYLTLAKKYCSDEEYEKFMEYLKQCIELFWSKQGETPQVHIWDEEAYEALLSALEEMPLHTKEVMSLEEQLVYERQFRTLVLEMQSAGYDMIPEMRAEFAETGLELYQAVTASESLFLKETWQGGK